jgi:S-DNA-T family DNA segregation ATPase FtsK/SpoIIIE
MGVAEERVLGDKVATTDKELAELLVGLEDHVTYVTQKYLGGSYDSLTNYNLAAGEVAEAYRLVLLYDYPQSFRRAGGGYDDEALRRLEKLVQAGRRCGVFIVAVQGSAAPSGAAEAAVSGLVPLLSAEQPPSQWVAGSLPVTAALPAPNPQIERVDVRWRLDLVGPVPADRAQGILAHVERGIASAVSVQVDPQRVHDLAVAEAQRALDRGGSGGADLADPSDAGT